MRTEQRMSSISKPKTKLTFLQRCVGRELGIFTAIVFLTAVETSRLAGLTDVAKSVQRKAALLLLGPKDPACSGRF